RDEADVDDAVQATFLVLLRKAGSVDRPGLLGNWLFGVALRTACDLRARNRRRRQAPLADRPAEPPPAADLEPLLDAELGRLPEMYRAPVVLCHLQGLSRRQAAEDLNLPEGTLSARLARAKQMLRARLLRRGGAVAVAAAAAALGAESFAEEAAPSRFLSFVYGAYQMLVLKRFTAASTALALVFLFG